MDAVVLEAYGRMIVTDWPEPAPPGPGQVAIAIAHSGICGTDVHGFTGSNGRRSPGQIMGHEASGIVSAVGEGTGIAVGTPVTFNPMITCMQCDACRSGERQLCEQRTVIGVDVELDGAYAATVVMPESVVLPLPDGFPIELGALVEPLAVALHATRIGRLAAADRLVILGGGPIGQCATVIALALGVTSVALSEPDRVRREFCASLGADVLDPAADSLPPADIIIDAVGVNGSVGPGLDALVRGGRLVLVGLAQREIALDAYAVTTAERSLLGSYCYSDADFADALALADEHRDAVRGLIARTVPLAEAPRAFDDLAAGGDPGKIVISF